MDDPVEFEVDVYLSQTMADYLCVAEGRSQASSIRPSAPARPFSTSSPRVPRRGRRTLLQFPLKPQQEEVELPRAASFKPKNQQLQLQVALPSSGEHYNPDTQDFARVSELTYVSSAVPMHTTYAIGVMVDGTWQTKAGHLGAVAANDDAARSLRFSPSTEKLVLTPLRSIFQMRVDFSYVAENMKRSVTCASQERRRG